MDRNRRTGIILATLGVIGLAAGVILLVIGANNPPTSSATGWESVISLACLAVGAILSTFGSMGISVSLGNEKRRKLNRDKAAGRS